MTEVNQLDFTGTTIYCGLDVHKISWRVNLRDTELELKDFTQPADASLLHKHLTKNYPGANYKAEFRLPGPSPRKETKFLCNHNVSRSTKCVAKCCGE